MIRCEWIKDVGYWKGDQCSNKAHRMVKNRWYCVVHAGMALDAKRLATQRELQVARQDKAKEEGL
jgi:hypothetical protein